VLNRRLSELENRDCCDGNTISESRYAPFGEVRWTRGASLTDFSFTGQRRDGFGLLDYHARFYSAKLGRFISADTIVPGIGNPLAWDKYVYGYCNPLNYIDPTGHIPCLDDGYCGDPGALNYQRRIYSQGIEATYNWHLTGDWSPDELKTIYQAGRDLQTYVNNLLLVKVKNG